MAVVLDSFLAWIGLMAGHCNFLPCLWELAVSSFFLSLSPCFMFFISLCDFQDFEHAYTQIGVHSLQTHIYRDIHTQCLYLLRVSIPNFSKFCTLKGLNQSPYTRKEFPIALSVILFISLNRTLYWHYMPRCFYGN